MRKLTEIELYNLEIEQLVKYIDINGFDNVPNGLINEYLSFINGNINEETGEIELIKTHYNPGEFEIISHKLLRENIHPTSKIVFMALLRYSYNTKGYTYVGDSKLAWWLSMSKRGIQRWLKYLEDKKWIKRETKYDKTYNRSYRIITLLK